MKNLSPLFLLFLCSFLHAQVTFENAFPNLTFNNPVEIQNSGVAGDDRLFVLEQFGRIRVFQNQSNTSFSSVFLDITNKVNYTPGQEKGLLGLAFHPNYNQNGYFYVSYTGTNAGSIEIIIERYSVNPNNPNQANSNSGCKVLSFVKNQSDSNHNGGSILFGSDGYLYISVGDGGGSGDPQGNAQNLNSLFGKVLRVNINTSCPGYTVPSSNPLVSSSGRDEIFAWGLRNTWKMTFDAQTNRIWGGDVGQGQFEEINLIQSGKNYGWKRYEANSIFSFSTPEPSNPTFPIYSYNHNQGDRSITGGYVYRGSEVDNINLFGRYIFGDFVSGRVWSLDYNSQNGATNRTLLFDTNFSISSFGEDINNELYFAAYGQSGRIYKLVDNNTNTGNCSVSTSNCSITLNGLNSGDFIKVFDSSFQEVWTCSPFGSNPNICNSTEIVTLSENGTYFVQACGETTPYTLSGCGQTNPCAGQGGDSDGDGVCNNQDCQPNNNAFPATPGTSCNDGNSNTFNDVITADGCGCAGTPSNTTCSVSANNCTITLNGLNADDFIKVFDSSFDVVWSCSPFGNNPNPCNSTEIVTGLNNGTYFVQACDETTPYTLSGCGQTNPCAGQGGDSDGDGICNNQDCQPNNNAFPATPGTSCNDGNSNTFNDVITSDGCGCAGTPSSSVCSVSTNNCVITLNGLNSDDFIKVFDSSFDVVWSCSPFGNNPNPCNSTEIVTGLENGTYFVQACDETTPYILSGCGSTPTGNCMSSTNVAQGKSTQQSSTLTAGGITGSSSKAVDGNTNGVFFTSPSQNSSVSATQNQSRPYWQVDLQNNYFIEEIKIYNRTDGSDRARDAYVLVSDQPFTSSSLSTSRAQADYEFFISGSVGSPSIISPELAGRYVRVQMQGSGFLTLGEVEVIGCLPSNLSSNSTTLIALPNADFLYFDGRKKDRAVELLWMTNMEPMNDFFTLERSSNGIDFEFLKEINSQGNSLSTVSYKELDEHPFYGKNYYRLIQILNDGTVYHSNIYEVEFDIDLNSFVIFPNPAQNKINVNLKAFAGQSALIQIFDARGVLVKEHQVGAASTYPEEIDLRGFVNGLYLMAVKVEGRKLITKPFSVKNLD